MRIENEIQLRVAYELLKLEGTRHSRELAEEIHLWHHTHESPAELKMINWDYDGYTGVVTCPKRINSKDRAIGYYEYHYRRDYVPSQYDCTGQEMTELRKVFKRNGRWMIWYDATFDV